MLRFFIFLLFALQAAPRVNQSNVLPWRFVRTFNGWCMCAPKMTPQVIHCPSFELHIFMFQTFVHNIAKATLATYIVRTEVYTAMLLNNSIHLGHQIVNILS